MTLLACLIPVALILVALWQPDWCRWVAIRLLAHADAVDAMRVEEKEERRVEG